MHWPLLVVLAQPHVPALTPGCLPADDQIDIWCPGDDGTKCFKIPSLARTVKGTLLAFVEARKEQCGDGGIIDLRLRRSVDNGKSWLASQAVVPMSDGNVTWGDACPVQDRRTGRVHLILTRNNADVFATHSDDDGASWAPPRNISSMVNGHRPSGQFVGTGHAGGLQLRSGRLLVPLHGPCRMVYSDDGGYTWALAPGALSAGGECQAVELRSGLLLATARNGKAGFTYLARSRDQGMTWDGSVANRDLPSPIDGCEASMVVHPNGRLYHSSPDSHLLRNRMVVRESADDGRTWRVHERVWPASAGYSSMIVLGNDTNAALGVLYDRNNVSMIIFEARGVTFTTVSP